MNGPEEFKDWQNILKDKDTEDAFKNICMHPEHNFPSMIVVRGSYTHTCPGCKKSVTVKENIRYSL